MKNIARAFATNYVKNPPKVLITGSQGQIGTELIEFMRERYGNDNVIASDVKLPVDLHTLEDGEYYFCDVTNKRSLENLVEYCQPDWIIHLGAFLSAVAETHREAACELNTVGLHNVLEISDKYDLRCFVPSSIAAFGPTTPLDNTGDNVPQRPRSVYGVGKVYAELLGEYYTEKTGLDFRSIRYPGVISWKTLPGGGTTDYSIEMFYKALQGEQFECYIDADEPLPMMYMEDCIKATIDLMEADAEDLSIRTYNVQGFSLTPKELEDEIKKHVPDFDVVYKPDGLRSEFAKSWPNSLDDHIATEDWGWKPDYLIPEVTVDMLKMIQMKIDGTV